MDNADISKSSMDDSFDDQIDLGDDTSNSATILLTNNSYFDEEQLIKDLGGVAGIDEVVLQEVDIDAEAGIKAVVLEMEGYEVIIEHHINATPELPDNEVAVDLSDPYWEGFIDDKEKVKSYIEVTIYCDHHLQRHLGITLVVGLLLQANKTAVGVYMEDRGLLFSKENYIELAGVVQEGILPTALWIKFFIGEEEDEKGSIQSSAFTYGMEYFDQLDIEVVNSDKPISEVYEYLFNVASHFLLGKEIAIEGDVLDIDDHKIPYKVAEGEILIGQAVVLKI